MKKNILFALLGIMVGTAALAQAEKGDHVWQELIKMPNQFNDLFDPNSTDDELTIVYIPGINNPFEKIYSKGKVSNTSSNLILVGGFGEMMKMMSRESKKSHLQEALRQYYKNGSTVLIDLDSDVAKLISINGYSIFTISKKSNKVLKFKDYGFDRIEFFKALKQLEITGS